MKCITVTLDGQDWTIREVARLTDKWGDCNSDTRTIRIARSIYWTQDKKGRPIEPWTHKATDAEFFDTLLHEVEHAQHPWMSEEYVRRESTERAKAVIAWYGEQHA
mgnify:CR=1 FL=1